MPQRAMPDAMSVLRCRGCYFAIDASRRHAAFFALFSIDYYRHTYVAAALVMVLA